MQPRSAFVALALAATLATPAVAASWMAYGTYEPDTLYDTPTLMWDSPPAPGQLRIYFNVYSGTSYLGSGTTNPNVGALRTHIEAPGSEQHWGILGIWTDCNGDGYVGMAETALREYPSQLLLDNSRCVPVNTGPNCWTNVRPCPDWPATGYNNANGWVTELIPIVGPNARAGGDARLIRDSAAAVWGDYGRPHDAPFEATCAITPLPRGTVQSSGGLLTYADCRAEATESSADLLGTWNSAVAAAGMNDLAFADDDDGTTGQLGQVPTLGDEHSDNAIVHAGDCSDPDAYALAWPAGLPPTFYDNLGRGIRNPDTNYVNPNGNVAGTVNYTFESIPFPNVPDGEAGPQSTSNCDFDDDRGGEPYSTLEGDFVGVSAEEKSQADWNFEDVVATRGGAPLGVVKLGPTGAPNDGGVNAVAAVCTICGHTEWFGGSTRISKPGPNALKFRTDVQGGDVGAEIDQAYWLSFYAFVKDAPSATGAALPGGTGTYGSAQCGGFTSGVHNGWQCDKSLWNLNADGTPLPDLHKTLATPGKVYNLRDVDCYDGRIGDTGVGILPAFYGDRPCAVG